MRIKKGNEKTLRSKPSYLQACEKRVTEGGERKKNCQGRPFDGIDEQKGEKGQVLQGDSWLRRGEFPEKILLGGTTEAQSELRRLETSRR